MSRPSEPNQRMKVTLVLLSLFEKHSFNCPLAIGNLKAAVLADSVLKNAVEISIRHGSMKEDNARLLQGILDEKPAIVGFSCYVWNLGKVRQLCRLIKERAPEVKIILGGPEVDPIPVKALEENPAADIVINGESEVVFPELLRHFLGKKGNLKDIRGLIYRQDGRILQNADMPPVSDLGKLPSPYLTGAIDLSKEKDVIIELSRGCVFKCRYCFDHKNYGQVRYRPLSLIEKELNHISKFLNVKRLYLLDSTFNLDRARAIKICKLVYKAFGGTVLVGMEARAELMDAELAEWFSKISVNLLEVGLQTTNPAAQEAIGRATNIEKFGHGIKLLKDAGIRVQIDLILGLPGDNFESFKKSFEYAASLKPDRIEFFDLLALPGTYLYEHAEEFNIEFDPKAKHRVAGNYSFSPDEIIKARAYVESRVKEHNGRFDSANS